MRIFEICICLMLLVGASASFPSHAEDSCAMNEAKKVPILWKHSDFNGECLKLWETIGGFGNVDFNDKASSAIVPAGASLILYEHTNYKGKKWVITGPRCVEDFGRWHDKASSAKLTTANTSGIPSCLR